MRMSTNNRYLVTFNFHHVHLSFSSLNMCLVRYPQIHMGSMAAIFGYTPPAYATRVVTRSFSTSIPNPWSPPQQLAIKSGHHRLTCFMSNLACSAGVFFCVPNLLAKNRVETSQREEEIGRVYRKGYYFYSPQSSTVIKSKMAATTIL